MARRLNGEPRAEGGSQRAGRRRPRELERRGGGPRSVEDEADAAAVRAWAGGSGEEHR